MNKQVVGEKDQAHPKEFLTEWNSLEQSTHLV